MITITLHQRRRQVQTGRPNNTSHPPLVLACKRPTRSLLILRFPHRPRPRLLLPPTEARRGKDRPLRQGTDLRSQRSGLDRRPTRSGAKCTSRHIRMLAGTLKLDLLPPQLRRLLPQRRRRRRRHRPCNRTLMNRTDLLLNRKRSSDGESPTVGFFGVPLKTS